MQRKRLIPTAISAVLSATALLVLSGCGGSGTGSNDSPGTSPTAEASLQGVAATGAALANAAVIAKCATGSALTGTTAVDGSFTLVLSGGQATPCILQVTGGTPSVTLHGFATEAGRVNITPLTDLVVTKALGTDPSLGFASFTSSKGDAIKAGLSTAKTYVSAQLTSITGAATATDIMTGAFKIGDADDKLLDALAAAVKVAGKSQTDLRVGAAHGVALKPLVQAPQPVVVSPVVVTPPVVTPPIATSPASGNECTPLLPKAGDSLTYQYTGTPSVLAYDVRYDFASTTYQGQGALSMSVTSTVNGVTSTSTTYTNPVTGAYLGASAAGTTTSTVTTFDPPDYQDRINRAVYNIGEVATVAVKARISGKGITDAFATVGGATALNLDYTFSVERKSNESLTVPAGTFANTCKLQINVKIGNLQLEGNDGTNALFASFFPTLSAVFSQPFKSTVWMTNKLPLILRTFVDTTSSFGAATATQELKAYTLAPR